MTREEQIDQILILVPPASAQLDQARANFAVLKDHQIKQLYEMALKVAKAGELLAQPVASPAEPPAEEEPDDDGRGIKV